MTSHSKKRRGISGLMQVAMIVGIVVIFAGILFTFASEIFTIQTTTNSIAMQRVYMYNAGGETFVSANVKNTGNHDITNVVLKVLVDTNPNTSDIESFDIQITPTLLEPGISGSAYSKMVYANGTAFSLQTGDEAAAVLEATSTDGSIIAEPTTIRVR